MSFLRIFVDGNNFKEESLNEDLVRVRVSKTDYIEVSTEGGEIEIRSSVSNVSRTRLMIEPISGNVMKARLVYH